MKFVKYSFCKKEILIIKIDKEEVVRDELISEIKEVFSSLQHDKLVDVLIDVTKLKQHASVSNIDMYTAFFQNDKIYDLVNKIAIVTNTPSQVVQTVLFMEGIQHLNIKIEVFSSVKFAVIWLNPNVKIQDVKKKLIDLDELKIVVCA